MPSTIPQTIPLCEIMAATGAMLGSTSSFSTRISLRWVPEPPAETTDTIVLSVGEYFIDLRMDKASGAIDWAMAGTRIVENPGEVPRMLPIKWSEFDD